jgi:hypothetical protein
MANTSKAKDKVENPGAHFAKPKEVVKDNVLSHDEKKGNYIVDSLGPKTCNNS